ncbi:hypothetical protein ACWDSF_32475 [Nocardia beijingensis]
MSGSNNDPTISNGTYTDNRTHLAWSAGPHACPGRSLAYQIAQGAIDQLLDALPEMRLAVAVQSCADVPTPSTGRDRPAGRLPDIHSTEYLL